MPLSDEPRDVRDEDAFDVGAALAPHYPYVPQMVAFCDDPAHVVGMRAVDSLVELGDLGSGHGYVARQVSGWSDRYRLARTQNVPDFEPVMSWLVERQPPDAAMCLIHNDFRLDRAGIAQQIHYRYVNGQTTNPAFQHIGVFVGYLDERRRIAGIS